MKKNRSFNKLWVLALAIPVLFLTACSGDDQANITEDTSAAEAEDVSTGEADSEQTGSEQINVITEEEIIAAQAAWGEGLVGISTAFAEGEDYVATAVAVLEDLYGYEYGPVLFKPTLANDVPFRFDWDGAASYFIGTSAPNTIEEDEAGFATNVWTAVSFEDDWTYVINGETAIGMGTVVITTGDGEEVIVHKSMAWFRGTDGELRLQLHHSSVPYGE